MHSVLFCLSILPFHPAPLCGSRRCPPRWPASLHGPQLTGQGLWSPSLAGCCCQEARYSSVLRPAPQTQTLGSHLPKLHRTSSYRHTALSPSPFGLWPPPHPCQGRELKFSVPAHLYHAWCLGKVTGQDGPKHTHNNKHLILWPVPLR